MSKIALFSLALFHAISVSVGLSADPSPPKTLPNGWVYVWGDEFSGAKIDATKWKPEIGIIRNQSAAQTYTNKPANLRVKGGCLEIEARHEPATPCPTYDPKRSGWLPERKTCDYTSASLNSRTTYTFTFGRVEIRAKIPKAKGVWPALWTLGVNKWRWPSNGEIDILEHISNNPDIAHVVFRWGEPISNSEVKFAKRHRIQDMTKDFHVYVMEWTPEYLSVSIDGHEVGRVNVADAEYPNGENPLRTPQHFILNLALGGWAEQPTPKDYPAKFIVDYVRVYQKKEHIEEAKKIDPATGKYKD